MKVSDQSVSKGKKQLIGKYLFWTDLRTAYLRRMSQKYIVGNIASENM